MILDMFHCLPNHSDVGFKYWYDNVLIKIDVVNDKPDAAFKLVQVAHDHQRVQRVDQGQGKTEKRIMKFMSILSTFSL